MFNSLSAKHQLYEVAGIMKRNILISIDSETLEIQPQNLASSLQESTSEMSTEVTEKENDNMGTPLQSDRWIYRIVVGALALSLISSIIGAVYLKATDKDIPDILTALGAGALGGLAGLLAPTPTRE
jgi:predicted phage tail protein